MIQSFACKDTATIFRGGHVVRFANVEWAVHRKLQMLDAALQVNDLNSPPGNRLERLSGNRQGQYSIRVNNQWRLCFRWGAEGPEAVELVDHH